MYAPNFQAEFILTLVQLTDYSSSV